jgi:hypothetical protein
MEQATGMEDAPGMKYKRAFDQRLQQYLDRSSPHVSARWSALALVALLYFLRVFFIKGFFIVTYGLGIYNLNLLLGFLTPQFDPEAEGPELPTKSDQEFRPFVRRLPEFKFWCAAPASHGLRAWLPDCHPRVMPPGPGAQRAPAPPCDRRYASIKSLLIGFTMTFFSVFDVPVFWPILLMYWFILFFVTMKRQIKHMIKYKYLPFSWGKKVGAARPPPPCQPACCLSDRRPAASQPPALSSSRRPPPARCCGAEVLGRQEALG